MSVLDLMARLRSAGVRVTAADGKLRVQAAKGTLTPELQQELAANKADILALLTPDSSAQPPLLATDRSGPLPLSHAQQRLWFLDELEPGTPIYNMPFALKLRGAVDTTALQTALNAVVARHEALRTIFPTHAGQAVQQVLPELDLPLQVEDLSDAATTALDARATELAQLGFDLAHGPLLRVHLLSAAPDQHMLVVVLHHIVSDLWSMDILFRDLSHYYGQALNQSSAALPALAVQYGDYAVWQQQLLNGPRLERLQQYWLEQLADAPPRLELPTDFARPAEPGYAGNWLAQSLPDKTVAALERLLERTGCTLFMVTLAVFAALLGRYARTDDLVVGTPIAGRLDSKLENLVGFFLNTLAVRLRPSGELRFSDFLQQVRQQTVQAFEHQALPFEKLVEELQPERDMSHTPVFQHMFICQDNTADQLRLPGLTVEPATLLSHGTAKFDLTLAVTRSAGNIELGVEYSTELYNTSSIERLQQHFIALLDAVAAQPEAALRDCSLLTADERTQVLTHFNATAADFELHPVHSMVEAQAAATPDAPAVTMGATTLSYSEFNARANRLAHRLVELGAGPGQRVALACERSLELPIAALAIVKTGACYVPIDPSYPPERVTTMLADSQALVCVTRSGDSPPGSTIPSVAAQDQDGPDGNLPATATLTDPLYCIYTSGSTGTPKGVQLSHAGLGNLLHWQRGEPRLGQAARTLQFASFSFDVSFQECFGAWTTGGSIVMVTAEQRQDLVALAAYVRDAGIERLYLPCAALQPLAESFLASALPVRVRDVIVAGEALQITPELRDLFAGLPDTRLHNHYGPSETHVVTALTLPPKAAEWPALPSIGRPVANTQCYVLDEQGSPAPIGVAGELYLGGVQVGLGYWNRAELSAEKFIASPFSAGGRMYRTGDAARWRADGQLEFLGRCDDQIKWRGYRVEPGEIETALCSLESVSQAVVVLREDTPGVPLLVAYVVQAGAEPSDARTILAQLRERLPDYMVPARLVQLDALPLTPSGKVARRRLPAPQGDMTAGVDYVAPQTPEEIALTEIWSEVLGVERPSAHADFFECGGHSLLATKVIARVSDEFGTRLPLKYLFRYPTPALLGAAVATLREARSEGPQTAPEDREEFRI